jgi:hypothetical protein
MNYDFVGTIGAVCVLAGFVANETGKLSRDSWGYDVLNLMGSGLLVIYALSLDSVPFIAINATWCAVSLFALFRRRCS